MRKFPRLQYMMTIIFYVHKYEVMMVRVTLPISSTFHSYTSKPTKNIYQLYVVLSMFSNSTPLCLSDDTELAPVEKRTHVKYSLNTYTRTLKISLSY